MVRGIFPGGKAGRGPVAKRGDILIDVDTRKVVALYSRNVEEIKKHIVNNTLTYFARMKRRVTENFKASIGSSRRDTRQVSRALGKAGYGIERGRQSGRFVGPTAFAFKGVRRKTKGGAREYAGYPNVAYADQVTQGIWRLLEEGQSPGQTRRPPGVFGPPGFGQNLRADSLFRQTRERFVGERGQPRRQGPFQGGPEFHPQGPDATIPNPGQPGWFYIRRAHDSVADQQLRTLRENVLRAVQRRS